VRLTPDFYNTAIHRLEVKLARAYKYAEHHFGGQNLYLEEIDKSIRHAKSLANDSPDDVLRRSPPGTLPPGIRPYPQGLAYQ